MLQTAHGSLTVGLDAQPGQTLLIRGGTSSVGMATAVLAKDRGLTVLSTTRRAERARLRGDRRRPRARRRRRHRRRRCATIAPDGVDLALELVGTPTLPDTLRATAVHGVVCFTGMLSNHWTVPDFYPIDYLPAASGSPPTAATPPTCPPRPAGLPRRRRRRPATVPLDQSSPSTKSAPPTPTWRPTTRPASSSASPASCAGARARHDVRQPTSGVPSRLGELAVSTNRPTSRRL